MADSTVIASTKSPQGRTVELTRAKWTYVQRHVEMRDELDLLLAAIRSPDFQEPDPRPGRERYWLRTQPPFPFGWLNGHYSHRMCSAQSRQTFAAALGKLDRAGQTRSRQTRARASAPDEGIRRRRGKAESR